MNIAAQAAAIQPDVTADDAAPSIAAIRSNREIAMEQIEMANMRRLEADGVVVPAEDKGANPAVDVPSLGKNGDLDGNEPQPEPTPTPAPEPEPKAVTVKIDGQEKAVTQDELIRSYQKNQAADRRLEEAARLLYEANERAAQLAAQIQQAPAPAATPAPDLREEVKNTLAVIYGGDEEAATEALTSLLAKTRGGDQPTPQPQPQLSVDELADAVQQRLEVDTAFAKIKTDYPDLVNDPDLEALTAMKISRAIQAGTPRAKAMLDSAEEVYRSLGKQPAGRQPEPANEPKPTSVRAANKANLDNVRSASSSATPPQIAAEETDPSSVIAEMAARRLGQSLPRQTG